MPKTVPTLAALTAVAALAGGCSSDSPSGALPDGVSRIVDGVDCYEPDLAAVTDLALVSDGAREKDDFRGAIVTAAASVKTPGPLPNGDKGSAYVTAIRFHELGHDDEEPLVATFAVASPTYGKDWYAFTINDVADKYFAKAQGQGREDTQAQAIACLDR